MYTVYRDFYEFADVNYKPAYNNYSSDDNVKIVLIGTNIYHSSQFTHFTKGMLTFFGHVLTILA